MLNHLRLAGIIDGLSGLIAGNFTDCGDAEEINRLLKEITPGKDIPVMSGLPVGHGRENKDNPDRHPCRARHRRHEALVSGDMC